MVVVVVVCCPTGLFLTALLSYGLTLQTMTESHFHVSVFQGQGDMMYCSLVFALL